jgi:hypothetical protein
MRGSLRKIIFAAALLGIYPLAAAQSASLPKPLFKSFSKYPIEQVSNVVAIATADLNGDGHPDVAALYGIAATVAILLNNGNGTFESAVSYPAGPVSPIAFGPNSIAIGDVNGDGKPDLVVTSSCLGSGNGICNTPQTGFLAVLLGNGDGTFQSPVGYSLAPLVSGDGATLADLNSDGYLDIAVIGPTKIDGTGGAVSVLLNDGKGGFHAAAVYSSGGNAPTSIVAADVNRDGHPDLIVYNEFQGLGNDGVVGVLLNNGKGGFLPAVDYDSGGPSSNGFVNAVVADFNHDGSPDIAALNHFDRDGVQNSTVGVLRDNGDGTFQPAVTHPAGYGVDKLVVADINRDGSPDLVGLGCNPAQCITLESINLVVYVSLGYGDGSFQSPFSYPGGGPGAETLSIADVNGDGRPDLLLARAVSSPDTYYLGVGLGELAPTKTTVASSLNPSVVNQTVTFTATVTSSDGPIPDRETITFYAGTAKLGTGKTASGVATLTTSALTAGTSTIKATYSGDNTFKTSSGTVKQIVSP